MLNKDLYYKKYLKYKNKYLNLQNQIGGVDPPIRQRSLVCSFQGHENTCYAHGVSKMVSRLLKIFFSTYFPYDKEMIDNYYDTTLCNTNKNIFDCFVENDFINDKSFENEHISALLFHFIYSILTDKFGKCNGYNTRIACLFILDYFKYIDITVELIKLTLKYSSKYEMTINTYFEKDLIIKLYNIFINIKKSFTDKTFNPILYLKWKDTIYTVKIIYMQKEGDGNIILFSSKVPNIPIPLYPELLISKTDLSIHQLILDKNEKLQKIIQTYDLYECLKYILKNGFYALFSKNSHVITITDYNDSDNTLSVKNTWGNSNKSKKQEHTWCGDLIRDNKININDLKLLKENDYLICFFYSEITVPSAPTIGKAIPDDSQCIVNWTASGSNGGSAIRGYTVTSSPDGKTATTSGATEISVIVKGLSNDKSYTFTVVAINDIGNSLPSSSSNSVTPLVAIVNHVPPLVYVPLVDLEYNSSYINHLTDWKLFVQKMLTVVINGDMLSLAPNDVIRIVNDEGDILLTFRGLDPWRRMLFSAPDSEKADQLVKRQQFMYDKTTNFTFAYAWMRFVQEMLTVVIYGNMLKPSDVIEIVEDEEDIILIYSGVDSLGRILFFAPDNTKADLLVKRHEFTKGDTTKFTFAYAYPRDEILTVVIYGNMLKPSDVIEIVEDEEDIILIYSGVDSLGRILFFAPDNTKADLLVKRHEFTKGDTTKFTFAYAYPRPDEDTFSTA